MIALTFGLYLLLVALIAMAAWRHTHSISDYLLGGRRIGAPVAALSAGASDMSGWLLLGLPGLAVVAPSAALWTALGLLAGTWANWRFVARPLRLASAELGAITVPDYFARRFPARGGLLRTLSALSIVIFFLLYTSAGLVAGGKLFNSVFGLPYPLAVALGALVIVVYTVCGGFLAVTWTDVLQAIMMSLMLGLVAALVYGDPPPVRALPQLAVAPFGTLPAVSALAWGLGYMGQPHILARFMAMADPNAVTRARRIGLAWTAFGLLTAVLIGTAGSALVSAGDDPERVFIVAAQTYLAPWLSGICLAAILAAIMSTADSQLLVTAGALAEDLLPQTGFRVRSAPARLTVGRTAVVVVCALATLLALDPEAQVFGLVSRAWAGFGATLGPALLIALYRADASATGAVVGMLAGALLIAVWPALPDKGFGIYELLPAFAVAAGANLLVNHRVGAAQGA